VPTSIRDRAGAPAGAFGSDEKTMHQHMKTFGIQFGLTGHLNDTDIPGDITQPVNWGDPFADPDAKTDDVRHAAVNGRGFFLTVFDPQELAGAMTAAFDEFSQAEGTASAVAFNSQQIREGNLIFRGFYDSAKNTGDLVAQELDADGFPIDPPVWSAAEELDDVAATDRTIVTFDSDPSSFNEGEGIPFRYASLSGEQQGTLVPAQVDYLRGDRSNERPFGFNYRERPDEEGMLGDIINSTPVYIGPPSALDRDRAAFPIDTGNLYSEFKNAYDSREAMVAVGANDGMLHVFNADTGEEMLAYIPDKIINGEPYANPLFQLTSLGYNHKYFVDLTPAVNDVFAKGRTDFTRRWRTVLVGGLRGGGKGYFALDLTDPSAFDTEGGAADKVLWEFTDADDVSPNPGKLDLQGMPVKDLGYTYSQPTLVMTNAEVGAARKRWAAVFGNGYNSTAGIAKLFALFVEDGVDGWSYPSGDFVKIDTGFGAPGAGEYNEGLPNGLGTPRLIDIDQNGTADIAYAGDMRGNLFRFDLRDVNPGNWDVTKVFTATYPDGAGDIPQPITTQPIVLKNPQDDVGYIVVFSTGSYITEPDGTSEEIQSIYGVWDRLEDNPQITRDDLVEQEIINLADPVYGNLRTITQNPVDYMPPSTLRGWYVDLDAVRALNDVDGNPNPDTAGNAPPEPQFPGERAIRNLQLRGGFLFVNTVIPRDDESCEASPGGFQMAMNPATGGLGGLREEVAFDLNNDGYFDDQDRSGGEVVAGLRFEDGVPTDSAFIGNRRYTQLSSREVTVVVTNTETGVRTGRLSWKEMPR
jgi:type IV pilus assembly protein PilY1